MDFLSHGGSRGLKKPYACSPRLHTYLKKIPAIYHDLFCAHSWYQSSTFFVKFYVVLFFFSIPSCATDQLIIAVFKERYVYHRVTELHHC